MIVEETKLQGCFILTPNIIEDARGHFFESFNQKQFESLTGQNGHFVQDNQSLSSFGVIRGLHSQGGEHAQAKLVRVIKGKVLDVAVDIRVDSPTYGQHVAVELSAENRRQLYIPRGFLHGFSVLSETAEFFYKCDNFYDKQSEIGVLFNDSFLNIDWRLAENDIIVSEKDLVMGSFQELGYK